jgi:hypothetical protein
MLLNSENYFNFFKTAPQHLLMQKRQQYESVNSYIDWRGIDASTNQKTASQPF